MNVRPTLTSRFALVAATIAIMPMALGGGARAAMVTAVPLGTAGNYSVLAGQTITNTGSSIFARSVGLSPGSSITGFPPGVVNAPGVIDNTNGAAAQAQLDLTAAYLNAKGRAATEVTANLTGLTLQGGVYSGPVKSALLLTGTVTLDAAGNEDTVFVFITDSTLTTTTGSSVSLINGAQQCNVFWQVGSSAELGSGSSMSGSVMALTSISVAAGATVYGRLLARNGSITLISDTISAPTCARAPGTSDTGPDNTGPGGGIPDTGTANSTVVWLAIGFLAIGVTATGIARRRLTSR